VDSLCDSRQSKTSGICLILLVGNRFVIDKRRAYESVPIPQQQGQILRRTGGEPVSSTQIEYDEQTLEFLLNTQAVRRALSRSNLFVLFLSANSIASHFVAEEQREAFEGLARGTIERIMIFCVDGTSYRTLPDWLRDINVVRQLSSAKACARQIQSALIALDAEEFRGAELYLGREDAEKDIRRAISVPPKSTPVAIHVVGFHGIGRRTFLRRALTALYPRVFSVFPEITLGAYDGIEEFYRSIYDLHVTSPLSQAIEDFETFSVKDYSGQLSMIATIVREMAANGELLTVFDEGGVYTDSGDYQKFIAELIAELSPLGRPAICFIQTRMMDDGICATENLSSELFRLPSNSER